MRRGAGGGWAGKIGKLRSTLQYRPPGPEMAALSGGQSWAGPPVSKAGEIRNLIEYSFCRRWDARDLRATLAKLRPSQRPVAQGGPLYGPGSMIRDTHASPILR